MLKRHAIVCSSLLAITPSCLFVDIQTPLDTNLDNTKLGSKVGESSLKSVLGLTTWGDAGIQAAAEAGGITNITHADRKIFTVLAGLYYKQTTVVYGE